MKQFSALLLVSIFSSACSSIEFSKKNMLIGTAIGLGVGAIAGATIKTGGMTRDERILMGAGIGAAVGSLTTIGFSKTVDEQNATFLEALMKRGSGKKSRKNLGVFDIPLKDLPKELQGRVVTPKVRVGKTEWEEVDGALHEPHRFFRYEEGGLKE